jgi:anti-sigma factor RsiW
MNDLLDGALDAAHVIALSEHLELCEACREEYRALQQVQRLLQTAPVPDGRAARLRAEASLKAVIVSTAPRRVHRLLLPAAASAGLAATALIVMILRPGALLPPSARTGASIRRPPIEMASSASVAGLPTASELDEMTSLHALESVSVAPGDAGSQQDTLADSTSRVPVGAD